MAMKFKSKKEKTDLAHALKKRRSELGFTLKNIAKYENIDASQLSRFENGDFVILSKNLQKYCNYLQIEICPNPSELGSRLEKFATRSTQHRAAAEEILNALERLG